MSKMLFASTTQHLQIRTNPSQSENGFYVESGWASIGNNIKVPTKKSKWQAEGNKTLTSQSPIIIKWDNNEGVIFKKKICSQMLSD